MPLRVKSFQQTPNPNALKCLLDARLPGAPRSYFKPQDAQGDPLAAALFAIPGVTNLLIQPDWITVSKAPETPWSAVKPAVEKVLHDHG